MPWSYRFMCYMPSTGLGESKPSHELLEITIFFGIENKMPMIGHNAICKNAHVCLFFCFCECCFKKTIIFICIKYAHPCVCTVYDVIHDSSYVGALIARHAVMISWGEIESISVPDPVIPFCPPAWASPPKLSDGRIFRRTDSFPCPTLPARKRLRNSPKIRLQSCLNYVSL